MANCPPCECGNEYLNNIPSNNCHFNIKQIQKLIFQRQTNAFFQLNLLETWQNMVNNSGDEKAIITPFIGGEPIITPGEAKTEGGGDNSTKNGIEIIKGSAPSMFSCKFRSLTPEQELKFKQLRCEKNLSVYFVNQDGKIFCDRATFAESNPFSGGIGFKIGGYFFSDRTNNGRITKDFHILRFQLLPCWSSNMTIISPEFNPLTDFPTETFNLLFDNENKIIFDDGNKILID